MAYLRLLRHPLRTLDLVWRRLTAGYHQRRTREDIEGLRRDSVDRCFCGGELDPFAAYPSYGVCRECGTYVNRRPPAQEELARLYSMDFYWHGRVLTKGQPPIERRQALDRADGRVEWWAELIGRHAPAAKRVLEVGVGSGVLLAELKRRGYDVLGVEPDEKTAAWTTEHTGAEVRAGLFPMAGLPQVDLFLAFDVLEHARDPVAFMRGAAALLPPGGRAIIQTPIDREHQQPPFGKESKAVFDDVEHCYVYTDEAMRRLAVAAGLEISDLSERLWVQHEIAVFAKPATA